MCLEFESNVLGASVLLPWSWNVIILNSATILQPNAKAILDRQSNASDPLVSNPIKKQKNNNLSQLLNTLSTLGSKALLNNLSNLSSHFVHSQWHS